MDCGTGGGGRGKRNLRGEFDARSLGARFTYRRMQMCSLCMLCVRDACVIATSTYSRSPPYERPEKNVYTTHKRCIFCIKWPVSSNEIDCHPERER